ncbi:MAG: glutamate decarboxylase [Clostridiales Family XIII bacterium]|jgi:glutamate decarboxylase|nr:glutamate decarboxylase [Clostridiales Family XIII bacterium]
MLYGKDDRNKMQSYTAPVFGSAASECDIPKYRLNHCPMEPRIAYRLVKDELLDEGAARQNLATFCQTYMEDEAVRLMGETLEKNAIDKSEYPRTAEIENRCVNIIADLWNAPAALSYMGTSTVGSSEACMLGGMAMKFRWRARAAAAGIDISARKPNLIISSGYQVCWEKFCVYFDVEMRAVPMSRGHMRLDTGRAIEMADEYTIGVVGILGITYTGEYDDIEALDAKLREYNRNAKVTVPIHVDAASGGLYTPFIEPGLKWDFRLENVVSINTSGHKYGLVYPGIGWIIWKHEEYLPKELVFKVSYLGGETPTMAINFSRSASQILGQYYNFLRYGHEGYRAIHERTRHVAMFLAGTVEATGYFDIYNDGSRLPLVCYKLKGDSGIPWTLYDLADRLQMRGWQVPAYPLPDDLSRTIIQRYVVRADFAMNMAYEFAEDFGRALDELNHAHVLGIDRHEGKVRGFTH